MQTSHPKANERLDRVRKNPVAGDGEYGYLSADDGTRLFYNRWLPEGREPDRVLVFLHGMGAHGHYYTPLTDVVVPRGVAMYAVDHRGHGLSDGLKGDMPDYRKLVDDARAFLRFAAGRHPGLPVFLIGESMGGAISVQVAMEDSAMLSGLILCAPALKPKFGVHFNEVIRLPYWLLALAFRPGARVVIVHGTETRVYKDPVAIDFEHNDPDHLKVVSLRYLLNVQSMMKASLNDGPSRITCPTLMLQGGDDKVCDPNAVKQFFERLTAQDKSLKFYEKGYHCLMVDPDAADSRESIASWITAH